MRLLQFDQQGQLSLTKDLVSNIPPYAILSHTWGDDEDEVTFDDLGTGLCKSKIGYTKLQFCGNQARKDEIDYFWVDTCCINKSNHAELSEAITSMYRWYRDAVKCYVYLSDVPLRRVTITMKLGRHGNQRFGTADGSQEAGRYKNSWLLEELIHEVTKIPTTALQGASMSGFSVDERLRWAAKRETKRKEDMAYCLLGIFNVFIPLMYGEEDHAFIRLNEEIEKRYGEKSTASRSPSSTVPFRRDADFVDRKASQDDRTLLKQIEQHCAARRQELHLWGSVVQVNLSSPSNTATACVNDLRTRGFSGSMRVTSIELNKDIARSRSEWRSLAVGIRNKIYMSWSNNGFKTSQRGRWLLVLDNLDNDAVLSIPQTAASRAQSSDTNSQLQRPLSAYLPQSQNGTILLTTRTRSVALNLVERRDTIPISTMNNADALLLFQKKLDGSGARQDLEELACLLEYMPLAIVQAAAYIQQKGERYSIRRYIDVFKKSEQQQTGLLKHEAGQLRRDEDAKNSIIATWQISFDDIREKWPLSAELLSLMSYFDRQGIPEAVLKVQPRGESLQDTMIKRDNSCRDNGKDEDEDVENDGVTEFSSNDRFEEALEQLLSYSLVTIGKDKHTFIMHGLVQLATRKWLEMQGKQERWKAQFCTKMNLRLPNGDYENWDLCETLFPHAKSAERQRPEGRSVQDWAQILRKAAWYAWAKGDYVEAERMCKKSVRALSEALGEEEVETSHSLAMLALIYSHQGRWTEAEKIEVQVIETSKRVLGDEHPDTLTSMNNLAPTLRNQGRWTEAEKIEVQVMETRKRVLGDEHPNTLTSMGNLASTYRDQGRWTEAEKIQMQVMETRKRVLGDEHPDTLTSMSILASTYRDQGRWTEAEKIEVQVMETSKRVLGDEHPDTLTSMNNLASTYRNQGRWTEAEKIEVQVIETSKRVLGDEHPNTLTSMNNLALTLRNQGRWTEAEKIQMQVMETSKRVLGDEHPDTLTSMNNLALTLRNQGRWTEAEKIQMQVMETSKRVLGDEHPDTLTSMGNLALTLWNQGRWTEAEKIEVQVMETRKRVLGDEHPDTLTSMNNLASTLWNQGRWTEAEKIEVQVIETSKRVLGDEHPKTLTSRQNLAFTLKAQGRDESAIQLMTECVQTRERVLGPEHPHTLSSSTALARWRHTS